MPGQVAYDVSIGEQRITSRGHNSDRPLLSLVSELGMDAACGHCRIELGGPSVTLPASGAAVTVHLDGGDGPVSVFSGEVESVAVGSSRQRLTAVDALAGLARLDVEATYEHVVVGDVVNNLLERAGVTPGTVSGELALPRYVVFRGPRALRHLRSLGELCGANLFTDGEGHAHFCGPEVAGREHAFEYGKDVLGLELTEPPLVYDGIEVWGEGAGSVKGADRHHWLVTDLSSVSAKARLGDTGEVIAGSSGSRPGQNLQGAIRSGGAAEDVARSSMRARASRRLCGFIELLGAPGVTPGDRVAVRDIPDGHPASRLLGMSGDLRVRGVRHTVSAHAGFVTRLEF